MTTTRFIDHSRSVLDLERRAAQMAIGLAGEQLLGEANQTVPHASGMLEASGTVTVEGTTAYVSYSTPYAVRQHEDTSLNHPDPRNPASKAGTRAKWLEETAREQSKALQEFIARTMRGAS